MVARERADDLLAVLTLREVVAGSPRASGHPGSVLIVGVLLLKTVSSVPGSLGQLYYLANLFLGLFYALKFVHIVLKYFYACA